METVAANMIRAIHQTLDGIEKCPKMYGTPEAIEFQYEGLLGILAAGYGIEFRAVRGIVEKVTAARVGGWYNTPMFVRASEEDLIAGLKEIRAEVEKLIQP